MSLIFSWDPIAEIVSLIFIYSIWIFRDLTLILWSRSAIKRESKLKFTKLLLVIGIILFSLNIISIFLPSVEFDFSSIPEESDFFISITTNYLYYIIPSVMVSILGVALVLFFYKNNHRNKKSIIGPIIILLGKIIELCVVTIIYSYVISLDWLDIASFESLEVIITVEAIAYIIVDIILVVGFCFVFKYSIYKNNALLIMYFGLYFASLLSSLFQTINQALIEFYPG